MVCTLTEEEKFVLRLLAFGKNYSSDKGYHHDKLKSLYSRKFPDKRNYLKFDKCIKILLNKGYITRIKKKEYKYYISKKSEVLIALGECGINVPKGRYHKL